MLTRLRHRAHGQEGFTLIELLVVVLIIGILAAVAIPAFLNQKNKAQDANIKTDLTTAQTSEETYFTSNQAYIAQTPSSDAALTGIEPALTTPFSADSLTVVTPATAVDGYALPTAPTASTANSYYIQGTSKSGVSFVLVHGPDGQISRVC